LIHWEIMAKRDEDTTGLSWGKSTVETACPLDCPDNCSLSVSVERGKIVKIDGNRNHALTDGYICAKVRNFAGRVYGEDRLQYPAVRKGPKGKGVLTRVSWDEALELIASKMRKIRATSGGEAILPLCYGGSNGLLTQDTTDEELFRRLGSSRLARTVCAAPTRAAADALYGRMPSVAFQDYHDAKLIVIWGQNPSASSIHVVARVREAQKRGAKLVVLDPRRIQLGKHADMFLALRPGTDLPVALALHRYLFENGLADERFLAEHTTGAEQLRAKAEPWTFERAAAVAGIDAGELARFAELYAASSPAVVRCGWGLERNRNGGHAVMAVLALPAVAGKFGVRGGGYSMTTSAVWKPYLRDWVEAPEQQTRIINMNQAGRALTDLRDPAIELLFVYNCNPVATLPDQNHVIRALQREDLFTVVFDQVRTDTAMYADVVLPATTFLESYDLARAYGSYAMQMVKPAIDAVGESRSNMEVFSDLAARLDLLPERASEPETDVETLLHVLNHVPEDTREALTTKGIAIPPTGPAPVQFVDIFPRTTDGKVHLHPDNVATLAPEGLYSYQPDPGSEKYPLALISPASEKTISSMLGELRTRIAALYMHVEDAAARGLSDDDAVRIFNDLGEVHCRVRVGTEIARGTVSLPKGLWRKSTLNRSTSNALAPDTLTDLGGGACFNDARVEVVRILDASFEGKGLALYVPASVDESGTVH
jgi:anaerobic selenocysteine-containing dehydrogenase